MHFSRTLIACTALLAGCSSADDAATADDALTYDPNADFHAKDVCEYNDVGADDLFIAEIDLTDHDNPRYRIRYSKFDHFFSSGFEDRVTTENNLAIELQDGSVWEADNLVARPFNPGLVRLDWQDPELYARLRREADARDPWDPLPVPKEFLEQGFAAENYLYKFKSWTAKFDKNLSRDPVCKSDFYRPNEVWTP